MPTCYRFNLGITRHRGWLDSVAATQRWAGPGVAFPCLSIRRLELAERPGWVLLDGQVRAWGSASTG
jgi:hypothetical protein